MRHFLFFGISTPLLLTSAFSVSAAPPQTTRGFTEQKNYCQPALAYMNQYYDGVISMDNAIAAASAEVEKCKTTNKLGYHLSTAQIHSIRGYKNWAAAEARAALALAPDESEAHRRLCLVLPNGSEKTSYCEGMKRFASQNVLINYTLGQNALNKKDYAQAIRLFDDVIARRPDYGPAFLERGRAKSLSGDKAGGLADLDQALQRIPLKAADTRLALFSKYDILTAANRHLDAVRVFDPLLAIFPKDGEILVARGESYLKAGQLKPALAECRAAYKIRQFGDTFYNKAEDCFAKIMYGDAGQKITERECQRVLMFGGQPFEISSGYSDDGKPYINTKDMKLADQEIGNAKVEIDISTDTEPARYAGKYEIRLWLDTRNYYSEEERAMRARAAEIGWHGGLSKKFYHSIHGELIAQNGAKIKFSGDNKGDGDVLSAIYDLPTMDSNAAGATPEKQHFGPAAFANKRFRLKMYYTPTGQLVADEEIFLPTDLDQRLVKINAATADLKKTMTPEWCGTLE